MSWTAFQSFKVIHGLIFRINLKPTICSLIQSVKVRPELLGH